MPDRLPATLHWLSPRFVLVGTAVAICFAARFVLSAPEDPPNLTFPPGETSAADASPGQGGAEQSYAGTKQCFVCHRPQTDTWSETQHVQAFAHLPDKYHNDPTCLKCHVTGFDRPGGYIAGADKDLLMVGCEACHGPGAQHIDAAQRFILADPGEEEKIEKEIRETIARTPTDDVCIACHITQTHQAHPAYESDSASPIEAAASVPCDPVLQFVAHSTSSTATQTYSKYSVKTCGGCHYDQYRQWRAESHADLAKMLSAQQLGDEDCRQCHPSFGAVAKTPNMAADPHPSWIGVTCESCHGPALEHVRFNRRFISGPPLGPQLEQAARQSIRKGKPASTCIQCHLGESHKAHPEIEKK